MGTEGTKMLRNADYRANHRDALIKVASSARSMRISWRNVLRDGDRRRDSQGQGFRVEQQARVTGVV